MPRAGGAAGVLKSRCRGVNLANSPSLLTPQSPTRQAPCQLVSLAVGGRPKTQARNWQGESDVEANAGSSLSLASTIGSDEPFPAEAALLLAASGWGIVCNPTGKVWGRGCPAPASPPSRTLPCNFTAACHMLSGAHCTSHLDPHRLWTSAPTRLCPQEHLAQKTTPGSMGHVVTAGCGDSATALVTCQVSQRPPGVLGWA